MGAAVPVGVAPGEWRDSGAGVGILIGFIGAVVVAAVGTRGVDERGGAVVGVVTDAIGVDECGAVVGEVDVGVDERGGADGVEIGAKAVDERGAVMGVAIGADERGVVESGALSTEVKGR